MPESNKPARRIKIGLLSASIWRREHDGRNFYNATFQRAYREKDGEEWKHSDSFGKSDLLELAKLADQAHTAILRLEHDDAKESELPPDA